MIPTRNRREMLARTLAGALRQQDVQLEVVVVDDSTDDATRDYLAGLGDARVRHVQGRARGVSDARNQGVAAAGGRWVAYLDDDDLWSPSKLRRQIDVAEAAGAVFAWSGAIAVDPQLQVVPTTVPAPVVEGLTERLIVGNAVPAGCSNVVARADAVARTEGYDEHFAQVADWDMWLQLAAQGPAAATAEVHVAYVQHDENMLLAGDTADPFEEFERLRQKHGTLAAELGTDFSRAHYARWVATRHRRAGDRAQAARMLVRESRDLRHAPGNLARAGAVLLGEPIVNRVRHRGAGQAERPAWLDGYEAA